MGAFFWSYGAGMNIDSSPAIGGNGMVYVGAQDKMLYALNSDGTLAGSYESGSWFDSSPAIGDDGRVYVGSHDNAVYALRAAIPTATPEPELPIVLISEILYNPDGEDNGHSFIELVGFAGRDISGWQIVGIDGDDGSIDEQFTFPPGSVFPDDGGGLGLLVVADEADSVTYVSHYDFTDPDMDFSNGPDNVQIIDNYGRIIDALAYDGVTPGDNSHFGVFAGEGTAAGTSGEGFSLVRYPALFDTDNNTYDFVVDYPNPGYAAGVQPPASDPVKISEVLYDALGQDEGRTFVELVGPAGTDISGSRLMGVDPDSGQSELIFMFPAGALFSDEGNGLGLLVVADTDASGITYVTHADYTAPNVNLPNGRYNIQLKDIDGNVVDALGYDAVSPGSNFNFEHFAGEGNAAGSSGEGYSLGRHPEGNSDTDDNAVDFEPQAPNPGAAAGVQPTPTPGATPSVTPTPPAPPEVKISELYYNPAGYDDGRAFIEIIGPAGTDAGEWYLVGIDGDTGEETQSYRFPEHAIIPDDGNGLGMLVVADLNNGQTEVANYDYAAEEIDLANGPDNLELRDAWGQVVDSLAYDLDSPGDNNHFAYFHGEGTAAGSSGAGLSLGRHPAGYSDTGDNAADFEPQIPNPGMAVGVQPTPTPTETPTVAPTDTPTITPTPTISPTPTATDTPEPTITSGGPPTATPTTTPPPADPLSVVINEIGWMGTTASFNDEWIELYNNTAAAISLAGWTLRASSGSPYLTLSGTIPSHGYYLLECGDDMTISDIAADKIYQGALSNDGEGLELKDHTGQTIDSANSDGGPWPAGSNEPVKYSMERINPASPGIDSNWIYNDRRARNGLDANSDPINGTPKNLNSVSAGSSIYTVNAGDIVINEVAWMGTAASPQDPEVTI
ncbi:MAG: lamin tail domain-containing protein [Candidatus Aureabacteria bacterium]|nr:lamin tail domain-containing protein [Candidatus Auribacterota bacterium]